MSKNELGPRIEPDHRAREVAAWLSTEFDPNAELLLVAEQAGDVTGFLAARLGDRNDVESESRVTLLYVSPEHQGRGTGRQLLQGAAEWLKVHAPGPVSIGAFEQNPFRSFYGAIGGVVVKTVMVRVDTREWPVVIYLWPSPEALQEGIRNKGA